MGQLYWNTWYDRTTERYGKVYALYILMFLAIAIILVDIATITLVISFRRKGLTLVMGEPAVSLETGSQNQRVEVRCG